MLFLSEWLPVDFQNHMDGSNNDRISKKKKKNLLLRIQYKVRRLQHQYLSQFIFTLNYFN